MANKLKFEQMQKSLNATNCFEERFGRSFNALVLEKRKAANRSEIYKNECVYILRGQYTDHNMPYISLRNENYDCEYTVIEDNGDCLTIKLEDRIIDIMPKENISIQENNNDEQNSD